MLWKAISPNERLIRVRRSEVDPRTKGKEPVMFLFETDKRPLTFLLDQVDQGDLALPDFQRAMPEGEAQELSLIFQAKGMSAAEADPAACALPGVAVS